MFKIIPFSILTILILLLVPACSKDGGGGGGGATIDCTNNTSKSFAANVNPIIQSTCNSSACHEAGSINGPGALTNYTQFSSSATSIRAAILSGTMPKNSSLSSAQKASIVCWIDAGALNN